MNYPVAEPELTGNEKKYLMECIDSKWISSKGKYTDMFEKKFGEFLDVKNSITVSNGTVALHLALVALGIKEGDEVIVPDFTYIATANAVKYVGATPIFVDADISTFNIDVEKIEEKITDKTRAIIPVHIFGNPCDMKKIMSIAKNHSIHVVEDAAESLGATFDDKQTGTFGIMNSFSFFGNKTITTGEGGMVTTNNDEFAETLRILKNQGKDNFPDYIHKYLGFNYRMTNMQAAVGTAQIEKAEEFVNKKKNINKMYREELKDLSEKEKIIFQKEQENAKCSYWMNAILFNTVEIKEVAKRLKEEGVDTRPFFAPMHNQPFYESGDYPVSKKLYEKGLILPSGTLLEDKDVKIICKKIIEIVEELER